MAFFRAMNLARLAALALVVAESISCSGSRPAPDPQPAPATRTPARAGSDTTDSRKAKARREADKEVAAADAGTSTSAPASAEPATSRESQDQQLIALARENEPQPSASDALAARKADEKAFESPLELVESWPRETTLDHADVRDARAVWPAMFNRASSRIDLAEFYLSDLPGSALEPSVLALEAAAKRGVKIRLLADSKMAKTYPETIARLQALPNVSVEEINFGKLAGGVQHAKYFVVDGAEAYEGSQNFDWRSLSQIQEMGLRFRAPEAVRALEDVFETDWQLAGGAPSTTRAAPKSAYSFPTPAGDKSEATLTFVASPQGWLPDDARWDLPAMVQLIDGAQKSLEVQVLTYGARGKHKFPELEEALIRAATRGVQVTLLVSNWSLRKGTVEGLQELAAWRPAEGAGAQAKPLEVKVFSIPQLKEGFVPFARVAHAKYMVIDGKKAWVGTNNWEKDYFTRTRNVGLIVDGGAIPPRLEQIFRDNLASPYAAALDPGKQYEAPRTGP